MESGEIVGADDDAFQGTAASRPAPGRPAAEENAERIASGALATSRSAKGAASCDYDVEIPERSTKKPRKGEWDGQHADPEGTEKVIPHPLRCVLRSPKDWCDRASRIEIPCA